MSWATCYNASNNIHFNSPPLMSDGRNYANWNPACKQNNILMNKQKIQSNFEYRRFLINNGKSLMKSNTKQSFDNCGVAQYGSPLYVDTNNGKYLYKSVRDGTQPYGYETSDLKNLYLTREQLQSKMNAPIMSQSRR